MANAAKSRSTEHLPVRVPDIIVTGYRRLSPIDTRWDAASPLLGPQLPGHVELAHPDPRGAVDDSAHDGVGMDAAPNFVCQSFWRNYVQKTVEHEP